MEEVKPRGQRRLAIPFLEGKEDEVVEMKKELAELRKAYHNSRNTPEEAEAKERLGTKTKNFDARGENGRPSGLNR